MTVKECYKVLGGDYAGTLQRLGKVEWIEKFLRMAYRDPSFSSLEQAMEKGDLAEAFRAAHTWKGIALNLGLTPLANAAHALTEALRAGQQSDEIAALQAVAADEYTRFCRVMEQWEKEGADG